MKRRQFVKGLAVGTGLVLAAPRVALAASDATVGDTKVSVPPEAGPTLLPSGQVLAPGVTPSEPDAPSPWWLLAPLKAGSAVLGDWSLTEVSPVVYGGFYIQLKSDAGESARVSVCRLASDTPKGLTKTKRLDLLLANAGHGRAATSEPTALAARALARVISANEDKRVDALPLLTCKERIARFGPGVIL